MINRIRYAFQMAWRYRKALRGYRNDLHYHCPSVLALSPAGLLEKGYQALAIDFDGVLSSYGEAALTPEVSHWLKSCVMAFGKDRVFVLTNNLTPKREDYFREHLSDVILIGPPQKKPYPAGILQILALTKLLPQQLLVIDDRLLTGILAAIIAGTPALYITKPFIALSKRPFVELFFMALRMLERLAI